MNVRVTQHFEAPAAQVFDAWLDASSAGRWLFATPTGRNVKCEIDARPGGRFVIVDQRDGEDVEHVGEYLEVGRPRRLVFTFAVPKYSSEVSRVAIDVAPLGAQACELTLVNDNVPAEWAPQTESGWRDILAHLGMLLKARAL